MTRLNDLHVAARSGTEVRWDPRSVDVWNAVETAHRMRSRYTAELLSKGFFALARLSGVTALCAALLRGHQRRRTMHELSGLNDRELADIGLERADISAIASEVTAPTANHCSIWHMLADGLRRAYLRRRTIRQLSAISDRTLGDIGIERADIERVATALVDGTYGASATEEQAAIDLKGARVPEAMALLSISPGKLGRNIDEQPLAANENLGRPTAA